MSPGIAKCNGWSPACGFETALASTSEAPASGGERNMARPRRAVDMACAHVHGEAAPRTLEHGAAGAAIAMLHGCHVLLGLEAVTCRRRASGGGVRSQPRAAHVNPELAERRLRRSEACRACRLRVFFLAGCASACACASDVILEQRSEQRALGLRLRRPPFSLPRGSLVGRLVGRRGFAQRALFRLGLEAEQVHLAQAHTCRRQGRRGQRKLAAKGSVCTLLRGPTLCSTD